MSWRIFCAGETDVGKARRLNEDALRLVPAHRLFVVVDGMSGASGGDVVANLAADALLEHVARRRHEASTAPPAAQLLEEGLKVANQRILNHVLNVPRHQGSGATIVALAIEGDEAHIAHVGDARAYLHRDGALRPLTRDHSWLNAVLDLKLDVEVPNLHAYKNVITRSLGMEPDLEVELGHVKVQRGDLFLLCSDGLHDALEEDAIARILAQMGTTQELCEALIKAANDAGGMDNVTVALTSVQRELLV